MMACVENTSQVHGDSEREEGEIVDELDELSDISSEEEFLLRQRLQVLENYNNVLQRKKAKRTSIGPGKNDRNYDAMLCDLSEISATELEEPYVVYKQSKEQKHLKSYHKPKRRKDPLSVNTLAKREYRKKSHKYKKKVIVSESSAESDDEYRNKRRKLEEAVVVNKTNIDKTSLKARLTKMLLGSQNQECDRLLPNPQSDMYHMTGSNDNTSSEKKQSPDASNNVENDSTKDKLQNAPCLYESVDLCSDSEAKESEVNGSNENVPPENTNTLDVIKNITNENKVNKETQHSRDSDDDLELLRQHALKTKTSKAKTEIVKDKLIEKRKQSIEDKNILLLSEDEDSDTAELRLICLKSALLKKAIEMKQKQKLKKRLSQSSNVNDEHTDQTEHLNQIISENNTDTESVDMDIGSDADEKGKEYSVEPPKDSKNNKVYPAKRRDHSIKKGNIPKEDEFEEDEDLLRANLLTSLSKNLPNLVDPNIMKTVSDTKSPQKGTENAKGINVSEEKRFIINLGNSDSEGEHEATKNLTKMHMKLSDQIDFQQKLDLFLKSTRMEVEKSTLPDVVQQPVEAPSPKMKEKFVPKTVKHLPKSVQIEYKNLVKRMTELEKIKIARQSSINLNKGAAPVKDTLKPRNVTIGAQKSITNDLLDEQIALSRKTIAEESAKVLKLKEDAIKLSQKYKIVATELRNIATAIAFNKREQRSAQIRLSKIRAQHKLLLNSTLSKHSISNGNIVSSTRDPQKQISSTTKQPQKENDPKEDIRNSKILRTVQVSVVNDHKAEENNPNPRLSIQIEVTSNKKTVKLPKNPVKTYAIENSIESRTTEERKSGSFEPPEDDRGGGKKKNTTVCNWGSKSKIKDDDYKSPLQALGAANWEEDPNAVLCPYEVGGNCKDPDCKYLHPKILPDQ